MCIFAGDGCELLSDLEVFFRVCFSVVRTLSPKKLIEMEAYRSIYDSAVCYGKGCIKI